MLNSSFFKRSEIAARFLKASKNGECFRSFVSESATKSEEYLINHVYRCTVMLPKEAVVMSIINTLLIGSNIELRLARTFHVTC